MSQLEKLAKIACAIAISLPMYSVTVSFPMVRTEKLVIDMRHVAAAEQRGDRVTLYTVDGQDSSIAAGYNRALMWHTLEFDTVFDANKFLDDYASWLSNQAHKVEVNS